MLSCLKHRRTSVLAHGEWVARPWDETSRGPRLYDKGFALATVLQDIDNAKLASADTSILTLSHCLQMVVHMDTELKKWYDEFLTIIPSPSYWPTPSDTFPGAQRQIMGSGPRGSRLLSYPNMTVASITVTFWALKLIISEEIATICQIILITNRKARADSPATDPAASLMLTSMAQRAKDQHSQEQRMSLVIDIARSMPYCLNHTMGLQWPRELSSLYAWHWSRYGAIRAQSGSGSGRFIRAWITKHLSWVDAVPSILVWVSQVQTTCSSPACHINGASRPVFSLRAGKRRRYRISSSRTVYLSSRVALLFN